MMPGLHILHNQHYYYLLYHNATASILVYHILTNMHGVLNLAKIANRRIVQSYWSDTFMLWRTTAMRIINCFLKMVLDFNYFIYENTGLRIIPLAQLILFCQ